MFTIAAEACHELQIKKSRFVARAAGVGTPEEAMAHLSRVRDPQASHNCWAWKIEAAYRFSDDGEPGGTAGRPILSAIEGQGLDHVAVVVTRYFGGIKLGAGGLVRAYSGVAAECLRNAARSEIRVIVSCTIEAPFDAVGEVHAVMTRCKVVKAAEQYSEQGVRIEVQLDAAKLDEFRTLVRDATRGRAGLC